MLRDILLELARKWDTEAAEPTESVDQEERQGTSMREHAEKEAERRGRREMQRECADALRTVIKMFG